jgi:hypothetical protein
MLDWAWADLESERGQPRILLIVFCCVAGKPEPGVTEFFYYEPEYDGYGLDFGSLFLFLFLSLSISLSFLAIPSFLLQVSFSLMVLALPAGFFLGVYHLSCLSIPSYLFHYPFQLLQIPSHDISFYYMPFDSMLSSVWLG